MKNGIYALYKGDTFICEGTIKEIAQAQGIKEESVLFYGTPAYQRRGTGNNRKTLIKLDQLEDDL